MTSSTGAGMMHFGAVDETTKRLVARCVQVPWLREAEEEQEREAAKKYLGIGMNPKAAESSLSVMEVATHKEKPGVQTPSREKDGIKAATKKKETPPDINVANEVGNGVSLRHEADGHGLGELKSPFEVEGEA